MIKDKLRFSKFVKANKRSDGIAVYHSILGNLCLLDSYGYELMKSFKVPATISEVIRTFTHHDPLSIILYINDLLDRGFLVISTFDEDTTTEKNYQWRKTHLDNGYLIRALQLVMTNKCNFSCDYCFVKTIYNSEMRSSLQASRGNLMMSYNCAKTSIDNTLNILRKNGNNYLSVEFFGGEPLMNWSVINGIMKTFKNGCKNDIELQYSVTTNGSLLTIEMANFFREYNTTITVSIDSSNCSRTTLSSYKPQKRSVIDTLEILLKANNYVTLNSVISRSTLKSFDGINLINIAKKFNVSMIGLILDLDLAFYENTDNKKNALNKIWETYHLGQKVGIPLTGYWHQIFQQINGKKTGRYHSGYKTCPAEGCKLSVEPSGHVFICKCCSTHIGHISNLEMVLDSPQYKKYALKAFRNAPECAGCEIEGFCSGVCMGALENRYNTINIIEKSTCDIYKKITRKLIKNIDKVDIQILMLSKTGKDL